MSLEEQQRLEQALKKQKEEQALTLQDQEMLKIVKGLGANDKESLFRLLRVRSQSEDQGRSHSLTPESSPYNGERYNQTEEISPDQVQKLIQIIENQGDRLAVLERRLVAGDVRAKVLSFLKDNKDKYVFASSLPHVQDLITDHYTDILGKGEKFPLEEVVAFYEKREVDNYKLIKEKENERGGELYPKALGQLEDMKEKAEAITKANEAKAGETGEKELDKHLTEKDKKDLERSAKSAGAEIKSNLQEAKNEAKAQLQTENKITPKKTYSNNVDSKAVDSLIKKHGFDTAQVQ